MILDIQDFTQQRCREIQREIATGATETKTEQRSDSKEKLDQFDGKQKSWDKCKRALIAYLNQIRNDKRVPLYYMIREPDMDMVYCRDNGVKGCLIYDAIRLGNEYAKDSFWVLNILRGWTSGGTAETYTNSTNWVEDSWDTLTATFEGLTQDWQQSQGQERQ